MGTGPRASVASVGHVAACWDQSFERVLRSHLPQLPPEAPLEADLALSTLGLESIGMMRLLVSLEAAYGIVLPDEAVAPATFRTARTIWSAVSAQAGRLPAGS